MTSSIASGDGLTSTTETVRDAASGDASAFALLCQIQAPAVAAYIGARCSEDSERDSLVRQVFVRAWRELPSLEDAQAFNLWLLRVAHDEMGAVSTRRWLRVGRGGDFGYVAAEMFELPVTLREVLALRYLFGCSDEELADSFGEPPEVIERWLAAGLEGVAVAAGSARRRAA
jgi:DNA-directed RNA polymerase specialized sigma24 family protein